MISYQQIRFVSGPFSGLLGKTIGPVGDGDEKWYVEVMIAGRPVMQEVPTIDIEPLK